MASPLELVNPSIAEIRRAEEKEREERLQAGNNLGTINAYKLADIFKNMGSRPVLSHNRGSNRYFKRMEERERRRRLSDQVQLELARAQSLALSNQLLMFSSYPHVIPMHTGSNKFSNKLEEQERKRRLTDVSEASIRRARAQRISDGIRVNAPTLKARLVKRNKPVTSLALEKGREALATASAVADKAYEALPSRDQVVHTANVYADKAYESLPSRDQVVHTANVVADKAYEALPSREQVVHTANVVADNVSAVADKAYEALPSREQVAHAANQASAVASVVGHKMAEQASNAAASATSLFGSMLNSASHLAGSVVHSVQHAYYGDEELHDSKLSEIKDAESAERQRRMIQDKDAYARGNGRKVSLLLVHAKFPKLSGSKGYNKYLGNLEERERTRRLANRDEADIREMNAKKVSRLLTMLGWPFIRDAKYGNQHFSLTQGLEEEERNRRLVDDFGNFSSRYNAGKIAQLIKDTFQEDKAAMAKHITKLEEKERSWRLANNSMLSQNAHKEAKLVSSLGYPFFVGELKADKGLRFKDTTLKKQAALQQLTAAEEGERLNRMNLQKIRDDQNRAAKQEHAAKLAKMLASKEDRQIAAKKETAAKVARLLAPSAPEFVAPQRISHDRAQDVARFVGQDLSALEEKERKARMSDKLTQHVQRSNAHRVAGMIKANNKKMALASKPPAARPPAPPAKSLAPALATPIFNAPLKKSAVIIDIAPSPPATFRAQPVTAPSSLRAAPVAPALPLAAALPASPVAPIAAPAISRPSRPAPTLPATAAPAQNFAPISPAPLAAAPISAPTSALPAGFVAPSISAAPAPAIATAPLAKPVMPVAPVSAPVLPARTASNFVAAPTISAPAPATIISAPAPATIISSAPYPLATSNTTTYTTTTPVTTTTNFIPIEMHERLIDHARKMHDQEVQLAEKESQKANSLRGKQSMFRKFRANHHEKSAQKHLANAQRHKDWLATQERPNPTLSTQPGLSAM